MNPEARRCPRCDRELIDIEPGSQYRTSDGRWLVASSRVVVCVGCHRAPAYCDCPLQLPVRDRGPNPEEGLSWFSEGDVAEADLIADQGDEGAEG